MPEAVANQVILNDVRLARVSLTKPHVRNDTEIDPATRRQKGTYHVDAILDASHPQVEAFKALMRAAVVQRFAEKANEVFEQIEAQDKLCLHQGDVARAGEPEYAGKLYISATNAEQPTIVVTERGINIANRGTPVVLTQSHPLWPYPGCYANVHLSIFASTNMASMSGEA
jgi:hypothetical protein